MPYKSRRAARWFSVCGLMLNVLMYIYNKFKNSKRRTNCQHETTVAKLQELRE